MWLMLGLFAAGAVVILFAGARLAGIADQLADRTGLGEAAVGAMLLGAVTSLPGLIASSTAAWDGLPEMAVSNAVGGIAAQTLFLVMADFFHKQANLEHSAASGPNLFQGCLLVFMLAMPLAAANLSLFSDWAIHPVSIAMVGIYVVGQMMAKKVRIEKMWIPRQTEETSEDESDEENENKPLSRLVIAFTLLGLVTAAAGWLVGDMGIGFVKELGWRQSVVGGLMTAVASSLPELVTTIACVRRGAYTLAVSGIVGGNAFDTLFVAVSDGFYLEGSIYHAMSERQEFLMALAMMMTAVLIAGMVRRERSGPANIGFEGMILIACYVAAVAIMAFA